MTSKDGRLDVEDAARALGAHPSRVLAALTSGAVPRRGARPRPAWRLAGRRHGRAWLGHRGLRPQAPGAAARRGAVAEAAPAAPATGTAACATSSAWLTLHLRLPNRTRMPRTKAFAA